MSNAIGRRYAKALFEISKDSKSLEKSEDSLKMLSQTLESSEELNNFIRSPLNSREESLAAIRAICKKAKFDDHVTNTLSVMATKRRLNEIPALVSAFEEMMENERGSVVAQVISASKLTAAQSKKIAASLKAQIGKEVAIQTEVDPSILGGLIVKIGSTMVDSSLKGKLSKLQNVMKEVG